MQIAERASNSQSVIEITDRCPWCNSPIAHEKFGQIQKKIRDEERKKLAATETEMQRRLDEQRRQLEVERKATIAKATEVGNKRIVLIQTERDDALRKVKLFETRESELRKKLKEEADQRVKFATEDAGLRYKNELAKQRQILDADRDKLLLKQQALFTREREAYQKKTKELERKLENAAAHQLGEGAEIDLFDELRDAFQGDVIRRITKSEGGADILHKVQYKGETCGSIVYDSKNRQAWRGTFVKKLRADQISAGADHAILSTSVFPTGKKELFVESQIIIASPARVIQIATLLRDAIIKIHIRGISTKHKTSKMSRLYAYITSDAYNQRFYESERLTTELLDLDVQEKKDHDNAWKKRGALLIRFQHVHKDIETEICAILETIDSAEED